MASPQASKTALGPGAYQTLVATHVEVVDAALDLAWWGDVSLLRDAVVVTGSFSALHIGANEAVRPTEGEARCLISTAFGIAATFVTLVAATTLLVLRGRGKPRLRWYELAYDLWALVYGSFLQKTAKPEDYYASVHWPRCTIFDSPPQMLAWLLGEALAFGAGVRLLLVAMALVPKGPRRRRLRVGAAVVAAAIALALVWLDGTTLNAATADLLDAAT